MSTTRAHGDFHLDHVEVAELERRRRGVVDLPWTMLDEVHGTEVVSVDVPGGGDRSTGDVVVTDLNHAALGVWVGDCAPVVIVAESGRFAVAHAGWRGLADGVLDVACDAVDDHGSAPVAAYVGPCIGPCCYEFGADDIDRVARSLGVVADEIVGTTSWGTPALDVPAAVTAALGERGLVVEISRHCTGCGGQHFSHRVRADPERHALVAWKDPSW